MKKRLFTLISCILIAALSVSSASASVITPRYDYMGACYIELTIDEHGLSNSYSYCEALNKDISMNMELQKREGSGPWEYVKVWDTSGSEAVDISKIWYVVRGYDYRLEVTMNIFVDGVCVETVVEHSFVVEF